MPTSESPSFFSRTAERTLEAAIEELTNQVKENFERQFPGNDFDEISKETANRFDRNLITDDDLLLENSLYVMQSTPERASTYPFLIAILHTKLAQRALAEGKREKGWSFVAGGFQFCATTEAISQLQELRKKAVNRRADGAKGAEEREKRVLGPVKQHLIHLLEEHVPEEGWRNPSAAVQKIKEHLWKFIEGAGDEIKNTFKKNNYHKTAEQWIETDKKVSEAFEKLQYPLNRA